MEPGHSSQNSSHPSENLIKGHNSSQCIWSSKQTSKMAGPVYISPLLHPRPDFLGVGRGRRPINIFSELIYLSRLSHYTSGLNFVNLEEYDELTDDFLVDATKKETGTKIEDTNSQSSDKLPIECFCQAPEIVNSSMACSCKEHATNESSISDNNNYLVFELYSNGEPSKQVDYHLNDKTLHLFDTLSSLKISFRTEIYKPKEHRLKVDPNILYCKNLFLKDRKGAFYLVICHEDQDADLKILRKDLKAYRNFNFATAQDMENMIGVEPGGVTPLALMNRGDNQISMVVCKSLQKENAKMMFHPMDSNLAVEITIADLLRFLKHIKQPVTYLKSN